MKTPAWHSMCNLTPTHYLQINLPASTLSFSRTNGWEVASGRGTQTTRERISKLCHFLQFKSSCLRRKWHVARRPRNASIAPSIRSSVRVPRTTPDASSSKSGTEIKRNIHIHSVRATFVCRLLRLSS